MSGWASVSANGTGTVSTCWDDIILGQYFLWGRSGWLGRPFIVGKPDFIDLVQDDLFVYLHHGAALTDIKRACDIVGDNGYRPDDVTDEGSSFYRVIACLFQ